MSKEFDIYGRRITDHKILSLEDWLQLDDARKDYAMYSVLAEQNNWRNEFVQESRERAAGCYEHFKRLEKRKRMDRATAVASGIAGGFIAMAGFIALQWEKFKAFVTS